MSKTESHRALDPNQVKDPSKPPKVLGRVTLRRKMWTVLRMNAFSHFVCGMCGKFYGHQVEAFRCLQVCARRVLLELRVKPLLTQAAAHFACPICGKQLLSRLEAHACLMKCAQKIAMQLKISVPEELPENLRNHHSQSVKYLKRMALDALPRRQGKFGDQSTSRSETYGDRSFEYQDEDPKDEQVGVMSDQFQHSDSRFDDSLDESLGTSMEAGNSTEDSGYKVDALAKSTDLPITSEQAAASNAASNNPKLSDAEVKLTRRKGQKPFTRLDARYGCTVCKLKYFTKEEVAECFNSHPLRE
jgi:hypothetical protein